MRRKAICFAILDDHSRLIVGARFEPAETELRLQRTPRGGLEARGVPEALYVKRLAVRLLQLAPVSGAFLLDGGRLSERRLAETPRPRRCYSLI